jgi:hypothetical protein
MINLEDYPDIFDDINKPFNRYRFEWACMSSNQIVQEKLVVQQVGSYKVSIAQSLDDLDRLQFETFNLSSHIKKLLQKEYPANFGYVVAIIDADKSFHPIAYTHDLWNNELFVPTLHHHEHKEDILRARAASMAKLGIPLTEEYMAALATPVSVNEIDWSHSIFVYNNQELPDILSNNPHGVFSESVSDLPKTRLPCLNSDELLCLTKVSINSGFTKNCDLLFSLISSLPVNHQTVIIDKLQKQSIKDRLFAAREDALSICENMYIQSHHDESVANIKRELFGEPDQNPDVIRIKTDVLDKFLLQMQCRFDLISDDNTFSSYDNLYFEALPPPPPPGVGMQFNFGDII